MKYFCFVCGCYYCFDGSTEESLPNDIKQHELGSFHQFNSGKLTINQDLQELLDLQVLRSDQELRDISDEEQKKYVSLIELISSKLNQVDYPTTWGGEE